MFNFLDGRRYGLKDTNLMLRFRSYKINEKLSNYDINFIDKMVSHEVDSEVYKDDEGYVIFGYLFGTIEKREVTAVIFKKDKNGDFIRGTRADDIYKRAVTYKELLIV